MAIYRGMDIGTAKPPHELRERVPHHLIDIVDPAEEYSVSQYVDAAAAAVADIRARGKQPLFVGGTPLYLKSLLRGLFNGPPANWRFVVRSNMSSRKLVSRRFTTGWRKSIRWPPRTFTPTTHAA